MLCLVNFLKLIVPYRDPTAAEKMNPFAEQEAWEEHQIGKLLLKLLYLNLSFNQNSSLFSILILKSSSCREGNVEIWFKK
jgi:hypothetical protein